VFHVAPTAFPTQRFDKVVQQEVRTVVLRSKQVISASIAALGVGALALTSTPAAAARPHAPITINGAGSTFINPIMAGQWIPAYQHAHPDVTINYQSVGSGTGISYWNKGQVNFAGSDALLNAVQLNASKANCGGGYGGGALTLPATIGAVSLVYNLPGVANLKLSPEVVAGIFLGQITTWSDPQIQRLNGGTKLPSTAIQTVHRADGSGTTYIFTHYLADVSSVWKSTIGPGGTTAKWPNGVGATGSQGVSSAVSGQPGSISYVDLAYAISAKLSYATVKNKSGQYVAPSSDSASVAAGGFVSKMSVSNLQQLIVNSPSKGAYPITGFSYIFMCSNQRSATGQALVDFVRYSVTTGQKVARQLFYAPLPSSLQRLDTQALDAISAHHGR